MLGFGATWYVDLFLVIGAALPALCGYAVVVARRHDYERHRRWQRNLFVVFTIAILGVEVGIRFGGVGPGIVDSPYANTALLRNFFVGHIGVALITYVVWLYLVVKASRRFGVDLPGGWSTTHRRLGQAVLAGLFLTFVTAIVVYYLGFVR